MTDVRVLACPSCGELAAVPFLYGMPTPDAVEDARRGTFIIAGCSIDFGSPGWRCTACEREFGSPEGFYAEDADRTPVERAFADYFDTWEIRLPDSAVDDRLAGLILDHGWHIRWRWEDDGSLEMYAVHRMTNDRHHRFHPDGSVEILPALEEGYVVPGDPDAQVRARDAFFERNRILADELTARGLYPTGDVLSHAKVVDLERKD